MNWIYDHTEVITTAALILIPIFIIGGMMILASGNTPEVSDLQGAPETLGDFPPLPPYNFGIDKQGNITDYDEARKETFFRNNREAIRQLQYKLQPTKGDIKEMNGQSFVFDGIKWKNVTRMNEAIKEIEGKRHER